MATMRSLQLLVLLVVCALSYGQVARAQVGQEDFVLIACGADTGFVDPETGLVWKPDTDYISATAGEVGTADTSSAEYKHFRYFPNTTRVRKNCYTLPVSPTTNYTVRASFWYINREVLGADPPTFALAVDGTVVANVTTAYFTPVYREVTYQSGDGNSTSLCLLSSGPGDVGPRFINAIALRPAVMYRRFSSYLDAKKIIRTRYRLNFGGNYTRFPQDYNDRIWSSVGPNSTLLANSTAPVQLLNTTHPINLTLYKDLVPENVLQTAVTVQNGNLTVNLAVYSPVSHMMLHFAELDNHTSNVSRKFLVHVPNVDDDSYVNARNFSGGEPYKPFYWYFSSLKVTADVTPLTFYSRPRSRLGPMINALEFFTLYNITSSTTLDQDVQAIESLKVGWNLSEWTGDPCVPVPHSWLTCTLPTDLTDQPRVKTLDLSAYNLTGDVPASTIASLDLTTLLLNNNSLTGIVPNFTALRNLQTLHLQNNQLSGSLPVSLVAMPSLRQLNVANNNLSGTIPAQLLAPPFNLTYRPGNPFLKEPGTAPSPITTNTAAISVGHVSGGVVITIAILTSLYM